MRTKHPAFWRYTAFQIPGWLLASAVAWWLHRHAGVPLWAAAGLPLAWVIKDYALYPFLRFAYEADQRRPIERLIGVEGAAVEPLAPDGYVRVRGELWRARRMSGGRRRQPWRLRGGRRHRGRDAARQRDGKSERSIPGTTSSAFR